MTLTEQQRAEGWREHDGGACPVPLDSRPSVMFRDGLVVDNRFTRADEWTHGGVDLWVASRSGRCKADIIAYRPEPQA